MYNINQAKFVNTPSYEVGYNYNTEKLFATVKTDEEVSVESNNYTLQDDVWTQIAVTYNGETVKLFANDVLIGQAQQAGNIAAFSEDIVFSKDTLITNSYYGKMDEIKFYKRALSDQEVQEAYGEIMNNIAGWNNVSYPEKAQYTGGISAVDKNKFKDKIADKPLNTGYEERNETAAIAADDKGKQLSITEEPHGGKFA